MNDVLYIVPNTGALSLSNEKENIYRKELIYVGDFHKKTKTEDVKFSVNEPLLYHWHNTFLQMSAAGVEVPVPIEHTTDPEKKRGSLVATEVALNQKGIPALFGFIKFNSAKEADQLKNSNVSIFVPGEAASGKGTTFHYPIAHVALTDYPVIPGLGKFESLAASLVEKESSMNIKALAKKLGVGDDVADDKIESAINTAIDALLKKVEKPTVKASLATKLGIGEDGDIESAVDSLLKKVPASPAPVVPPPAPVALGFVNMLRDNRKSKLAELVKANKISPAVVAELEKEYCTDGKLQLALSADGSVSDSFDTTIAALAKNDVVKFGEHSGPQTFTPVALSNNTDPAQNPLIADADRRAAESKK